MVINDFQYTKLKAYHWTELFDIEVSQTGRLQLPHNTIHQWVIY